MFSDCKRIRYFGHHVCSFIYSIKYFGHHFGAPLVFISDTTFSLWDEASLVRSGRSPVSGLIGVLGTTSSVLLTYSLSVVYIASSDSN